MCDEPKKAFISLKHTQNFIKITKIIFEIFERKEVFPWNFLYLWMKESLEMALIDFSETWQDYIPLNARLYRVYSFESDTVVSRL